MFAFDRSARRIDADGRLHVDRTPISKAAVNPYYGREIPGYEALGLDADRAYMLLRDPVELEQAASTFARLPILSEHVPVTVTEPQPDLVVGAIGSDIIYEAPYLYADICVWDEKAIAGIETKQVVELSCCYRYVPVMESGEFDGVKFDGRMTQLAGNHLAIVEAGRAGPDVYVADSKPTFKELTMKMSKIGKALFAALGLASKKMAADAALPALVANLAKDSDIKALKTKLLAMDDEMDPAQIDAVVDSMMDVQTDLTPQEPPAPAAEQTPMEKIRAMLTGKVADDVIDAVLACLPAVPDAMPPGMKPGEVKAAMDSMRNELKAADTARREVREIVGDVIGMDTPAEVYIFALDHMTVDHAGITDPVALRALFKTAAAARNTPTRKVYAADGADSAATRFPGLARFG